MHISDWQSLTTRNIKTIPFAVQGWIELSSSMTAAVSRAAGGTVSVNVSRQEDGPLNNDERMFFPADERSTLREVCLTSGDAPLLVARTVFTSEILRTHPRIVNLGTKHLGSLLFEGGIAPPNTARQFCKITQGTYLFDLVRQSYFDPADHFWGRRTLFWLFDAPLLVTEIMLPNLICSEKAAQALNATAA